MKKTITKEKKIINWMSMYMKKKNYKIDYYTRQLIGITKKELFQELEQVGFTNIFDESSLELIEKHIDHDIYYDLPVYRQCSEWIILSDGAWNIKQNLFYEKNQIPVDINQYKKYLIKYSEIELLLSLQSLKYY